MKAESERTEVVQNERRVLECLLGFISRARNRLDLTAFDI